MEVLHVGCLYRLGDNNYPLADWEVYLSWWQKYCCEWFYQKNKIIY